MSAFIVSNKTMNQAIEAMRISRGFDYKGMYLDDPDHIKALGAELFKLNASAVAQRYKEPEEETEFQLDWQDCNKFQALKALACLTYQCGEGNVPETELYKVMKQCESFLQYSIIAEMPEYKAAKWDAE